MNVNHFIKIKIKKIKEKVGKEKALVALSGGVDSSVVTVLAYRAIGNRLISVFINDGLMREREGLWVKRIFRKIGIPVKIINAQKDFFKALKDKEDPEIKRAVIEWQFYGNVLPKLCRQFGAKYLFQGTILTDIEETKAKIKLQHNVRPGLNPKRYGLPPVIEPLKTLRKPQVREVARALGLPKEITERPPFLGPGLAGRIIGEVTPKKVKLLRKATKIVEEEFERAKLRPFQAFPVLMADKATGIRNGKRQLGNIIVIRSVESKDARTATASELPWQFLTNLRDKILKEIPQVNRALYDLTDKPPATIEYI